MFINRNNSEIGKNLSAYQYENGQINCYIHITYIFKECLSSCVAGEVMLIKSENCTFRNFLLILNLTLSTPHAVCKTKIPFFIIPMPVTSTRIVFVGGEDQPWSWGVGYGSRTLWGCSPDGWTKERVWARRPPRSPCLLFTACLPTPGSIFKHPEINSTALQRRQAWMSRNRTIRSYHAQLNFHEDWEIPGHPSTATPSAL